MSAKLIKRDDALVIKAESSSVGVNEAREYLSDIKNYPKRYGYLIFDFSDVTEITSAALRNLTFALSITNQLNAKVAIVGSAVVSQCISDCHLEKVFPYYSSVNQIFEKNPQTSILQNTLKDELDDAIKTTFQTITGSEAHAMPFDSNAQNYSNNFEIGAIIGISDTSFKGSLILGFSVKSYLNLMSKMFGATYSEVTSEISDGPAEVLNMIYGHLKIALNNNGFSVSPAIPITIMGSNLRIVPCEKKSSPIVLLYESEFGTFYVELNMNYQSMKAVA